MDDNRSINKRTASLVLRDTKATLAGLNDDHARSNELMAQLESLLRDKTPLTKLRDHLQFIADQPVLSVAPNGQFCSETAEDKAESTVELTSTAELQAYQYLLAKPPLKLKAPSKPSILKRVDVALQKFKVRRKS